ncbi:hypothetical protein [Allonocardiopsis opalescens]|uniref:Uncharacterized protein n=1 Tax=Allonocardiopsis opalescens TaxID=1144618 RepID=A0A2T0PYK7_9ACTN|nr:hypothetical protein [Allonocardiopsis opalescens]PRX96598.1 hypothetical protein CLV72_107121 [Allonocardiopsis opalescens]
MPENPNPRLPAQYVQWIEALPGSQINVLQHGDMHVNPEAPSAGSPFERLQAVSDNAVAYCDIVAPRDGGSVVRLAEGAYVRRTVEERLLRRLDSPSLTALVGEAGYGKSVLMWRLHQRLRAAGRNPLLIPATSLLGDGDMEATLSVEMIAAALQERPTILLVDTLDLLLHEQAAQERVARLLAAAAEARTPTLVTSRPVEARTLTLHEDGADAGGLPGGAIRKITLSDYDPRERTEAIVTYAAQFYPEDGRAEVVERLQNANVRGLPLQEVCRNPLALRLLFELYAPDEPPETDVDTIGLYDQYWQRRVVSDTRGPGTAGSGPDLTAHAHGVALALLSKGSIESTGTDLAEQIRPLSGGSALPADKAVGALHARGVLTMPPSSRRLRFFHQTLFEHAAARAVAAVGEPAARVLFDCVRREPHDLFYGEVAAQLMLLAKRRLVLDGPATATLVEWLSDQERGLLALAMRTYARITDPGHELREAAARALQSCERDVAIDHLTLLPSVNHGSFDRIGAELGLLWRRAEKLQEEAGIQDRVTRREGRAIALNVLEALSRLAAAHPDQVLRFLQERECLSWLKNMPSGDMRNHKSLYLRVLEPLYAYAPRRCASALVDFFESFAADGSVGGAAEILDLFDRHPTPPLAEAEMMRIMRAMRVFRSDQDATALEMLYVRLREPWLADLSATELLERTQTMLGAKEWETVGRRAELRALSRSALTLTAGEAGAYLEPLLRTRNRTRQEHLLTVLGTVLQEAGEPPAPLTEYARKQCRRQLARLPAKRRADKGRPLPLLFVNALYGARTSGPALLAALPEVTSEELWSDPDGLIGILAAAALAGHETAAASLRQLLTSRRRSNVHVAVLGRLREAAVAGSAESVDYLILHAEATGDLTAIREVLSKAPESPVGVRERLHRLRASFVAAKNKDVVTQGAKLWRTLVDQRVEPYPTPSEIVGAGLTRSAGHSLSMALLQLADSCLRRDVWTGQDVSVLVQALGPYVEADLDRRTDKAATVSATARTVLIGLHARHTPLPADPVRQRAFATDIMELVYTSATDLETQQGLAAFTRCVVAAAPLPNRIADPTTTIELVTTVARRLHELQPQSTRWRRNAAQSWHTAIAKAVISAPADEVRRMIQELLGSDEQMARLAVAVCVDHMRPIPDWLKEMEPLMTPEIHKRMRGVMSRNARDGSPRKLPALYEKAIAAASSPDL